MDSPQETRVFSVSELAFSLKKVVETTFSTVCVRGEVSGLRPHSSGHLYFALKDNSAVLDVVFWHGVSRTRRCPLEDGTEIRCWAQLTTYPARSKYQLVMDHYELAGQGALFKMIEERKRRLLQEGVFDAQHKKKLPFLPRRIGVVTSPTGAVFQDILHRIADRFPTPVLLWPVLVQGEEAASQVAAAIRGFNRLSAEKRPEVLIVARGGGSFEDLLPFNEEEVVRAVFDSQIPVISAIGHETDTTLIDYVADVRAPTPTAAAEMVVPVRQILLSSVTTLFHQLGQGFQRFLEGKRHKLTACTLPSGWHTLGLKTQALDHVTDRLRTQIQRTMEGKRLAVAQLYGRRRPPSFLVQEQQVAALFQRNTQAIRLIAEARRTAWLHCSDLLEKASFTRILERGFALAQSPSGHLLSSAKDAHQEARFDVVFHDGTCPVTPLK